MSADADRTIETLRGALQAAQRDRDEAREWVRKLTADTRVLTCVYCGHAYPPGTPSHGSQILTEHIASCEKHPLTIEHAAHERTKARVAELEHDAYGLISRANYLSKISSESWEEMKAERDAVQSEAAALSKRVAELEAILGRQ